jgi:hypothetical protein
MPSFLAIGRRRNGQLHHVILWTFQSYPDLRPSISVRAYRIGIWGERFHSRCAIGKNTDETKETLKGSLNYSIQKLLTSFPQLKPVPPEGQGNRGFYEFGFLNEAQLPEKIEHTTLKRFPFFPTVLREHTSKCLADRDA